MRQVTEEDLKARCGLGHGVELRLSPDESLTPSARERVRERNIRILTVSSEGRVMREGKTVHPLSTEAPVRSVDKSETQTHLNSMDLVSKAHPRIWFRGKVDSCIAAIILVQTELAPVLDPTLQGLLADLRSWIGWAMRCEVLEEPVPMLRMGPFSMDAIVQLSQHPERLGLIPLRPDPDTGPVVARLNWLRAMVRETELAAIFTFRQSVSEEKYCVQRADLIRLFNCTSSALYVLMLLERAGERGIDCVRREQ